MEVPEMTRYIAAYDTENPSCLPACRKIRAVHEEFGLPATFFIVGRLLEDKGTEYRALLGDVPSFEIASHTYSHRMLRDHPHCGPAAAPEDRLVEIRRGVALIEDTFSRPCLGLRPGCGFDIGLRGDPWLVDAMADAGLHYVSSLLWGPDMTLPAMFEAPFNYEAEGHPALWELPAHGWHENVLKTYNLTDRPRRILAWPPPFPEAVPPRPLASPQEEAALYRLFIDRAMALGVPYVSLVWHPWSLNRFDPAMEMLRLTFGYVRELGLQPTTFAEEWRRLADTSADCTGAKRDL
jgi:hypothetical protein